MLRATAISLRLMISMTTLFMAFGISAMAQASSQQFENINFAMSGSRGELSFDRALIKDSLSQIIYRATTLDSSYANGVMSFNNNEMLASFKVDGKNILAAIAHLELQGGQLKKDSKSLVANFAETSVGLGDGIQHLQRFDFDCSLSSKNLEPIKSCLFNFKMSMEKINIDPASFKTVQNLIPGTLAGIAKKKKTWSFEEVEASTGSDHFSLSFKLKILLKLKFSIAGKVVQRPQSSEIGFTVESAKLSLFSIKNLLLKVVEIAQIQNVRVDDETIFIRL